MATLVVVAGDERGREITLPEEGEIVIGRALGDVNFPDGRLSRKHCAIYKSPAGYVVKDMNSTNGVFVNGMRVSETILEEGDKIRLGYTVLEFEDGGGLPGIDVFALEVEPAGPDDDTAEVPRKKRKIGGKSKIMAAKYAAMGKIPEELTESRRLISAKGRFCEACGIVIKPEDLEADKARRLDGLYLCETCVSVVEDKGIAPKDVVSYLKWKEQEDKTTKPDDDTDAGLEPIK
ncbi:MAG: FHA domain-containing protein [Planctomycetes bacterium]|nr:FHA domain-containing protein [Planctomycetota bacterium]